MPEPRGPLKWRGDEESLIPCRLLSGVCILVGTIHFIACHGKADFVLVTLIIMCFAPWMGHVFESIGKEGVKFRVERGESPTPPASAPAQTLPSHTAPHEAPPVMTFIAPEVSFQSLSTEEKTALATMWKYQQIHIRPPKTGVWTLIGNSAEFSRAMGALTFLGLVSLASNGQFGLTARGLEYCRQRTSEIGAWPHTWDNFSN